MTTQKRKDDIAFIEGLADLLERRDLSEIEVLREYGADDSLNVRVSRTASAAMVPAAPIIQQVAAPTPHAPPLSQRGQVMPPMHPILQAILER